MSGPDFSWLGPCHPPLEQVIPPVAEPHAIAVPPALAFELGHAAQEQAERWQGGGAQHYRRTFGEEIGRLWDAENPAEMLPVPRGVFWHGREAFDWQGDGE